MPNRKISLLIPTRERPQMLRNFVRSIYEMTHHKKNLELLFICDLDDSIAQHSINEIMTKYTGQLEMRVLIRPRSEMLNEDYYNFAARQATGDLLWVLADDLEIVHPGWDVLVQNEVENFTKVHPDMIFCVSIKDNTPPPSHRLPKFPCFPMLTKEAREALGGWILHPKVPTWGADYITYCIFEPMGRLIQMHNTNYINHISWHNKQVGVDTVNQRIGEIFNKLKMVPHHNTDRIIAEEVPTIRNKILDYVRDLKNKENK